MIVFVHGVPETAALWDKLRSCLDLESTALSMPGFGCARPYGFGATKDDYVNWLVGELGKFDEPVDLVGHDWGAGLTYRVATAHGELLRSWSADVASIMHPTSAWHAVARIWQTPGDGEQFFADQEAIPLEDRGALFETLGIGRDDAQAMARAMDATMGTCILDLYRSAMPNCYADWGRDCGPTAAPGLVICPSEDPFTDETKSLEVAAMLGAHQQTLAGLGHWWPLQDPAAGAQVISEFVYSIR